MVIAEKHLGVERLAACAGAWYRIVEDLNAMLLKPGLNRVKSARIVLATWSLQTPQYKNSFDCRWHCLEELLQP